MHIHVLRNHNLYDNFMFVDLVHYSGKLTLSKTNIIDKSM